MIELNFSGGRKTSEPNLRSGVPFCFFRGGKERFYYLPAAKIKGRLIAGYSEPRENPSEQG